MRSCKFCLCLTFQGATGEIFEMLRFSDTVFLSFSVEWCGQISVKSTYLIKLILFKVDTYPKKLTESVWLAKFWWYLVSTGTWRLFHRRGIQCISHFLAWRQVIVSGMKCRMWFEWLGFYQRSFLHHFSWFSFRQRHTLKSSKSDQCWLLPCSNKRLTVAN